MEMWNEIGEGEDYVLTITWFDNGTALGGATVWGCTHKTSLLQD